MIYLKTFHNLNRSSIELGARIQANGGHGKFGGSGGAGGLILFDKVTTSGDSIQALNG